MMNEPITSLFQLIELIEKETMVKERDVSADIDDMDVEIWSVSGDDAEKIASIDIYDFVEMTLEHFSIKMEGN